MKEYVATSLETHLFFGRIMRGTRCFSWLRFRQGKWDIGTKQTGSVSNLKMCWSRLFGLQMEW